jgi:hypothetical protein
MILQEKQSETTPAISGRFITTLSVSKTLTDIKERGYQLKFRREATCLFCMELNRRITPDSFMVDEYYHFEDNTNPDGDRTIYAISTIQGINGFLVDTCLVYEDNISPEMNEKLIFEYLLENNYEKLEVGSSKLEVKYSDSLMTPILTEA